MASDPNAINEQALREHVSRQLSWSSAHQDAASILADVPEDVRGAAPAGLPYTPWQLLEHLRRAQHDILEFCRDPDYTAPTWPDDYWPDGPAPPSADAWNESVGRFLDDLHAMQTLVEDPALDLFAAIPHGDGQTYLREALLAADHNAYHLGEFVVLRRLLGAWS